MKAVMRLFPFIVAISASSGAVAETVLDTSTATAWRASLTKMAIECDGQNRGPCFLKLLEANKKIEGSYFDRFLKEVSGSSPAYRARYNEMVTVRDRELKGITRAEIFRRADALK